MVDRPDSPRERILTAAADTLQAGGAAGFTTRQIAAAAGVNPGLIHYHCGSLAQLRAVLAERHFGQTLTHRRAALLAPGPFMERWHALLDVLEAEGRETAGSTPNYAPPPAACPRSGCTWRRLPRVGATPSEQRS